jgi:hypothetical protein
LGRKQKRKGAKKIYFHATFTPTFGVQKIKNRKGTKKIYFLATFPPTFRLRKLLYIYFIFSVKNLGISILWYYSYLHKTLAK